MPSETSSNSAIASSFQKTVAALPRLLAMYPCARQPNHGRKQLREEPTTRGSYPKSSSRSSATVCATAAAPAPSSSARSAVCP